MKASDCAKTLALAAVVLYVALVSDFGFLVIFLLPFLFIWFIVGIVLLFRKPQERRRRAVRMAIWASALVIIGVVQGHRADAARGEAEGAVRAVMEYKARNGSYPSTLADAGIDEARLYAKWMLKYSMRDRQPALFYPATFLPLDSYSYDFEHGQWIYNSY